MVTSGRESSGFSAESVSTTSSGIFSASVAGSSGNFVVTTVALVVSAFDDSYSFRDELLDE